MITEFFDESFKDKAAQKNSMLMGLEFESFDETGKVSQSSAEMIALFCKALGGENMISTESKYFR